MTSDPKEPASSDEEQLRARVRSQRELGRYAGLGLQLGASITVFALAGYWLDGHLGTLPLFLLVGVFAGFAGGMIAVIRKVPPVGSKNSSNRSS